jgi:L-ribulose-5-phosphate 4-epimerase
MTIEQQLLYALLELEGQGLAVASQGNASVRDGDVMLIKASGIPYDDLVPGHMVPVNLIDGSISNNPFQPSTDTEAHRYIYNKCPEINAIVHTHSTYATAFAAQGLAIPCCLTEMADVFGGRIPCMQYADIGDDTIGRVCVARGIEYYPAFLLANHGVLAVGKTIDEAVKHAVLVEHCAKIIAVSRGLWGKMPLELTSSQIQANHERFSTRYGQIK